MRKLLSIGFLLSMSTYLHAVEVPQDVTADLNAAGTGIEIGWTPDPSNDFYRVYQGGMSFADVDGSDTSLFLDEITDLETMATYFVTGCSNAGLCSGPSASATFTPDGGIVLPGDDGSGSNGIEGSPQNVTIEDFGDGTAVLRWDEVIGAEKYNIDKNFRYIGTTTMTSGTLRDTNTDPDGNPQFEPGAIYRISAVDEDAIDPFGPWSAAAAPLGMGGQCDDLIAQIAGLESTIEQLQASVIRVEGERDAARDDLAAANATIASIQDQVAQLQATLDGLGGGDSDSDTALQAALAQVAQSVETIGMLQSDLEQAGMTIATLQADLAAAGQQANADAQLLVTAQSEAASLGQLLGQAEADLATCRATQPPPPPPPTTSG